MPVFFFLLLGNNEKIAGFKTGPAEYWEMKGINMLSQTFGATGQGS